MSTADSIRTAYAPSARYRRAPSDLPRSGSSCFSDLAVPKGGQTIRVDLDELTEELKEAYTQRHSRS